MVSVVNVLELPFPVIGIRGSGMVLYRSPQKLTSWTSELVASRAYEALRLIDSDLREYIVADARIVGPSSRVLRWLPLVRPRQVDVHLDLEVVGQLSLADAKERLLMVVDRAPDFWDAYDIEELRSRIGAASSAVELARAVPG